MVVVRIVHVLHARQVKWLGLVVQGAYSAGAGSLLLLVVSLAQNVVQAGSNRASKEVPALSVWQATFRLTQDKLSAKLAHWAKCSHLRGALSAGDVYHIAASIIATTTTKYMHLIMLAPQLVWLVQEMVQRAVHGTVYYVQLATFAQLGSFLVSHLLHRHTKDV